MKVGLLTGGGDCPGLNPVIRGVVKVIDNAGGECLGLLEGWRGAITGNHIQLTPANTDSIFDKGGTILGSSRTNPWKNPAEIDQILETFKKLGLDCLVAIGGDDTLGVASKLYSEKNFPTIGCPKTIDNDLSATDQTFGFDTCINIVTDAIDRLRTTAESHRRILVVEVMGRHAGWIACYSAIANGADYFMVPEKPVDLDDMVETLKRKLDSGKKYGIVVVSEGAKLSKDFVTKDQELDEFGHVKLGGIGDQVAKIIEERMEIETRSVILGHLQRGGSPSAFDRVLGTRCGVHAGQLALDKDFGKMVALKGTRIVGVPLKDAVDKMRVLDDSFYEEAAVFLK
ncbi:6-phosphofructokinase [Rubinisphaera margarita]|uniref:6-phosphofructokinase n=1 Tax=Rubinisphaera margarita TaxID=2909586 RepID=UPI001EE80881|nr:ATP-dependent 6-phosphofructokinase [Rubinisphaera margarita]MCG6155123.1 6-phosphofructokinase [Rubinisphaera margarita]